MFNFAQNIELSILIIATILAIVMVGLLITRLFKKIDKKQIFFLLFIYLLVLIRIFLDIYLLYFSGNVEKLVNYSNFLSTVISIIFFYVNRKKIEPVWLYLLLICLILFNISNLSFLMIPFTVIIYYIYMVLLGFYNIILYLAVLSFLINSDNNGKNN